MLIMHLVCIPSLLTKVRYRCIKSILYYCQLIPCLESLTLHPLDLAYQLPYDLLILNAPCPQLLTVLLRLCDPLPSLPELLLHLLIRPHPRLKIGLVLPLSDF